MKTDFHRHSKFVKSMCGIVDLLAGSIIDTGGEALGATEKGVEDGCERGVHGCEFC